MKAIEFLGLAALHPFYRFALAAQEAEADAARAAAYVAAGGDPDGSSPDEISAAANELGIPEHILRIAIGRPKTIPELKASPPAVREYLRQNRPPANRHTRRRAAARARHERKANK